MSSNTFCPKCNNKMARLDGKKLGGIIGNKYWTCLPCKVVRPVKHRIFDAEKRAKNRAPRGGPLNNR